MLDFVKFIVFVFSLLFIVYPVWLAFIYSVKRKWSKNRVSVICIAFIFSMLINPLTQVFFLESYDTEANNAWRDKAVESNIIGKKPDEIRDIFGQPTKEWIETPKVIDSEGAITFEGETFVGWKYHVLPFYWLGSGFEVFFIEGRVTGFQANDD